MFVSKDFFTIPVSKESFTTPVSKEFFNIPIRQRICYHSCLTKVSLLLESDKGFCTIPVGQRFLHYSCLKKFLYHSSLTKDLLLLFLSQRNPFPFLSQGNPLLFLSDKGFVTIPVAKVSLLFESDNLALILMRKCCDRAGASVLASETFSPRRQCNKRRIALCVFFILCIYIYIHT